MFDPVDPTQFLMSSISHTYMKYTLEFTDPSTYDILRSVICHILAATTGSILILTPVLIWLNVQLVRSDCSWEVS